MVTLSQRMALRAACKVYADALRRSAGIYTREGAAAVNVKEYTDVFLVRAGAPTGRWGWTPIQAWMFAANGRHPLFGHPPWYHQLRSGPAPFLDEALATGTPRAQAAYAATEIDYLAKAFGYSNG